MVAVLTSYHNAAQSGSVKLSTRLAEFYLLISYLELMKQNGFVTKLNRHSHNCGNDAGSNPGWSLLRRLKNCPRLYTKSFMQLEIN